MNTDTKKRSAILALLALIVGLVIPLTSATTVQAQTPTSERLTAYFTGIEFVSTKAPMPYLPAAITRFPTTYLPRPT